MKWRAPLTSVALLLMETFWWHAIIAFLVALTVLGDRPTVFGTGAVVFASFGISRFLRTRDLDLQLVRIWGIVLSLLVFYAIIRIDFFHDWHLWDFTWSDRFVNETSEVGREHKSSIIGIPLLWLLWLRGILRGQQHTSPEEVTSSFGHGVLVIAFVALLTPAVDAPPDLLILPIPYVAIGLFAIALAHSSQAEEEFGRSYAPTWLIAVSAAVVLVAFSAFALIAVDYQPVREGVADASVATARASEGALNVAAWPFEQAFNGMYAAMHWFFHDFLGGPDPNLVEQRQEQAELNREREQQQEEPGDPPDWLILIARIFGGTLLVSVILASIYIVWRRFAGREGPRTVRETTYSEGRLRNDVGGAFGSLLGRLRPRMPLGSHLDPARRLYYDMLDSAEKRGVERRDDETPLELTGRIETAFTSETPRPITHAFNATRYGGVAPAREDIERLRREWDAAKG